MQNSHQPLLKTKKISYMMYELKLPTEIYRSIPLKERLPSPYFPYFRWIISSSLQLFSPLLYTSYVKVNGSICIPVQIVEETANVARIPTARILNFTRGDNYKKLTKTNGLVVGWTVGKRDLWGDTRTRGCSSMTIDDLHVAGHGGSRENVGRTFLHIFAGMDIPLRGTSEWNAATQI